MKTLNDELPSDVLSVEQQQAEESEQQWLSYKENLIQMKQKLTEIHQIYVKYCSILQEWNEFIQKARTLLEHSQKTTGSKGLAEKEITAKELQVNGRSVSFS